MSLCAPLKLPPYIEVVLATLFCACPRPQLSRMPKANGCRPRVVVITQGCDPTIVAVGGKVHRYPVIVLAKEQLVDTNGAGERG